MTYVTGHFADCLPVISQLSSSFVSELELLDYLFPGYVLKQLNIGQAATILYPKNITGI